MADPVPPLLCVWNANNEHLQNITTAAEYRRCRKPATVVAHGASLCDEHLAAQMAHQREYWERRMASPY